MIKEIAVETGTSVLVKFSTLTTTKAPLAGLGAVGIKTVARRLSKSSLVRKPTDQVV